MEKGYNPFTPIHFSPHKALITCKPQDTIVALWNYKNEITKTLKWYNAVINPMLFPHDGKQIPSASYNETVHIWNVKTNKQANKRKKYYGPHYHTSETSHLHPRLPILSKDIERNVSEIDFADSDGKRLNQSKETTVSEQLPQTNEKNLKHTINKINKLRNNLPDSYRCSLKKVLLTCSTTMSALLLLLYYYR